MLTLDRTTRRTPPILGLVVLLGLAVFFWGLHCKLSLYQSGAIQSTTPEAKLLSQKERPVRSGQVEHHLLSGQHIFAASLCTVHGAAALSNTNPELSDHSVEGVESQNSIAELRRHLDPWNSRGPPIAI